MRTRRALSQPTYSSPSSLCPFSYWMGKGALSQPRIREDRGGAESIIRRVRLGAARAFLVRTESFDEDAGALWDWLCVPRANQTRGTTAQGPRRRDHGAGDMRARPSGKERQPPELSAAAAVTHARSSRMCVEQAATS